MDPRVEEYLQKLNKQNQEQRLQNQKAERQLYLEEKEEYLIDCGLYDIIFLNNDAEDYSGWRINPETGKNEKFKEVAIDISDEDYEALLKADIGFQRKPVEKDFKITENKIGKAIRYLAITILFASILIGIIYGNIFKGKAQFNLTAALIIISSGTASSILLLGFSEIIFLLQKIADKK